MNLTTTYLGKDLKSPLVAASSPLSKDLAGIRSLEDGGAAAVVLFSLFEEQLIHESKILGHYLDYGSESFAEALSYFPEPQAFHAGPDEYLNLIRQAKSAVGIPIIGSLNGYSSGGWVQYAKQIADAGADAVELNIYYLPTDPDKSGAEVEQEYVDVVKAVCAEVTVPVAVKVGPYFSSTPNMAKRLVEAGAKGLVLFNRFYQPDFDLDNLEVAPRIVLSNPNEMRLPMHWIALLYGRIPVDFAITSGVHTGRDVVKAMMAGAKVTMLASELLMRGTGRLAAIQKEIVDWMTEKEYESIQQMQGSMSQQKVADPAAFERANYMKELQSFRPDPAGLR